MIVLIGVGLKSGKLKLMTCKKLLILVNKYLHEYMKRYQSLLSPQNKKKIATIKNWFFWGEGGKDWPKIIKIFAKNIVLIWNSDNQFAIICNSFAKYWF